MPQASRLRYFAACNSENGFHSFYSDVFPESLSRVYIIKGGPGTGKSSLMRRAADRAVKRGYRVEEIYCSSDPNSLDGVIAYADAGHGGIAVLDGTAPHIHEAALAGARDEILNMGEFWSCEALVKRRKDIETLSRARSEAFAQLYRYLQAAGQCARNMESVIAGGVDARKIRETITSILTSYPIGGGASRKIMLMRSIGMSGAVRLSTMEEQADSVYLLRDCGSIAYRMLDELSSQAEKRHLQMWISYDPLMPSRMDGIYLPEMRSAFLVCEDVSAIKEGLDGKKIHQISMRRYVSTDLLTRSSGALSTASRNRDRLMRAAYSVLDEIREKHFSLEQIYKETMDFTTLNRRVELWLDAIMP